MKAALSGSTAPSVLASLRSQTKRTRFVVCKVQSTVHAASGIWSGKGAARFMQMAKAHQLLIMTCLAGSLLAAPIAAQVSELGMLDTVQPGMWEIRLRPDGSLRTLCVRNGRDFIQLQHRQPGCTRFVVQDDATEVIVQYTCRGDGYGRTTIRREGSTLVQLQSQGSQGGAPFSIVGEARRTGAC